MNRLVIGTLVLCLLTAAGVLVQHAPAFAGGPVIVMFSLGPPAFLALLAWRRRTHPSRSRLLFFVAVVIAVSSLGLLAYDYLARPIPRHPLILPLAQWFAVLAVWIQLVKAERREKLAGKKT